MTNVSGMALYEITDHDFRPLMEASFADLKVRERQDLQRLLRSQVNVLADDLYVLAEEFGDWEDSRRRIDLLAIDKEAKLVVIELKRTQDGGHMDLQAIRYASMVSAMTFERAVQIHADFLQNQGDPPEEARSRILGFLGWSEASEDDFADDVRILLVSEDFGKELTTAVLWLRDREIDIRCIKLRPYSDGGKKLIDVQQIIPLPEAAEYQIQLREKEQEGRKMRAERSDVRQRFWEGIVALCRQRNTRHANIKPGPYHWLGASAGVPGFAFNYVVVREYGLVELYIDRGDAAENKQLFDALFRQREAVEKAFGGPLVWQRLEDRKACRVKLVLDHAGYLRPESEWPAIQQDMVSAMLRLEAAFKPAIEQLGDSGADGVKQGTTAKERREHRERGGGAARPRDGIVGRGNRLKSGLRARDRTV